jgi:hypothetical protein
MKLKAVLLVLTLFAFACQKEKGAGIPVSGALTTGTWYVSKFTSDSLDETNIYNGYTFIFNTNGELTASCTYGTTVGSWYAEDDNDGSDEFRIALGNIDPLDKLSKRWKIRSQTSSKVELFEDDHGSDEVTFTKQ